MLEAEQIQRPTLLLDEARCRANIRRMAEKAARSRTRLRPHAKTHQSAAIAEWCRQAGVEALTTSSLRMARYFADHGWRDITIAFPVNGRELAAISALAARVRLGLLVANEEGARILAERLRQPADIWLEVDTGEGRSGIAWHEVERLDGLRRLIEAAPPLRLRGPAQPRRPYLRGARYRRRRGHLGAIARSPARSENGAGGARLRAAGISARRYARLPGGGQF